MKEKKKTTEKHIISTSWVVASVNQDRLISTQNTALLGPAACWDAKAGAVHGAETHSAVIKQGLQSQNTLQ